MKKVLKLLFHRAVLVGAALTAQVAALIVMISRFQEQFVFFYGASLLVSTVVVLVIINARSKPGYKIAWIVPILLFPIFGGLFFVMLGGNKLSKRVRRKMQGVEKKMRGALPPRDELVHNLASDHKPAAQQAHYIQQYAYCPPYQAASTEYLSSGEAFFGRLLAELRQAQRFIFLEYFIIGQGQMWDAILGILRQKASQGVDVRVIYDDVGCLMTLPYRYDRQLEEMGIKCSVFNPVIPILNSRLNNRDHRKIAVIDGNVAFTGGANLADEYINVVKKFGHWKDAAIMIKGDAVWSFTVMFLAMWDYLRGTNEDYSRFRPQPTVAASSQGIVQPFSDNPLDDEAVGETVYLNLINKAESYIYVTTPYLILDCEISTALCCAAKNGVDVRLITPHIPDKWFVHAVTRDNYGPLLESGVRIYEYTLGFIHAKTMVVDDRYGVVGTINWDYRSLYLHFECGVWLYNTNSILQIKRDFLNTEQSCQEITLADYRRVPWLKRAQRAVLHSFAPLM